jgi:hypothetical protein
MLWFFPVFQRSRSFVWASARPEGGRPEGAQKSGQKVRTAV